ncbi:Uncharacterised protein [Actinomyces bovis]|uniref:Uncharacterized protein n=1 Tax=Actinomyces bovis TaxID=1658 RepID=A0ABY1VNZ0_9ACTO|nr:Uncharacterised protein [Actinomyces bovis]SPT53770.1 Uncharacterised protein [Actinomyces bovis]VEG53112.1 Uncharacterised protein [Actinomyces israelii]
MMQYNAPRPWQVSLAYLGIRDGVRTPPIRRVCVHGNGHGLGRATHVHTYQQDGRELCAPVDDTFPQCPISPSVSNEERCMMFMAFARLCHVDTSGLAWVDPPEGTR